VNDIQRYKEKTSSQAGAELLPAEGRTSLEGKKSIFTLLCGHYPVLVLAYILQSDRYTTESGQGNAMFDPNYTDTLCRSMFVSILTTQ